MSFKCQNCGQAQHAYPDVVGGPTPTKVVTKWRTIERVVNDGIKTRKEIVEEQDWCDKCAEWSDLLLEGN